MAIVSSPGFAVDEQPRLGEDEDSEGQQSVGGMLLPVPYHKQLQQRPPPSDTPPLGQCSCAPQDVLSNAAMQVGSGWGSSGKRVGNAAHAPPVEL